jgi:hypothetical protein
MIWVQHDLYKNFTHSIKSDDIGLSLDIFRSEISDLLTYNIKSLFQLFDKLKIKYSTRYSYSELLDIIIREIKKEDGKFTRGLSFLMVEGSSTKKQNKKVAWVNILNNVTKGIKIIAKYFKEYPEKQRLFKRKTLEMLELKSSITGNDNRDVKKKDNTLTWILALTAIGVAGYFLYRYFDKQKDARLKAESLRRMENGGALTSTALSSPIIPDSTPTATAPQAMPSPLPVDPSYVVPSDVLIPESPAIPNGTSSVQINVQSMPQAQVQST